MHVDDAPKPDMGKLLLRETTDADREELRITEILSELYDIYNAYQYGREVTGKFSGLTQDDWYWAAAAHSWIKYEQHLEWWRDRDAEFVKRAEAGAELSAADAERVKYLPKTPGFRHPINNANPPNVSMQLVARVRGWFQREQQEAAE